MPQTVQFARVTKDEILSIGKLGLFLGKGRQPDVMRVGRESRLELFQTQQMRRARFDVIESVFVLSVVAQNFLKQLIQFAEVVIRRRPFDRCRRVGIDQAVGKS